MSRSTKNSLPNRVGTKKTLPYNYVLYQCLVLLETYRVASKKYTFLTITSLYQCLVLLKTHCAISE
jgi:hypothetical protein